MSVKEIAYRLEELEMKAWVLSSTMLAVSDAIIEGPNGASNFNGAIHGLSCMTTELEGELKLLKDSTFESMRKKKGREKDEV